MPGLSWRAPRASDLPFLTGLFALPEMVAHRPEPVPDPPAVSAARLEREIGHWQAHGFGRWAVLEGETLVGFGGVTRVGTGAGLNISYHIHPRCQGRGIASATAARAVAFGFETVKAQQIRGLVRPANPGSLRVLEKLGFRRQGLVPLGGAPSILLTLERDGSAQV
ncbi:GNAT family N-acetyltransferase [Paroceanicella profunda]|uniref:GNAT family N-acetyltransferase n=1 Tax=Paroceanicella profunda TaxID=2579971 RepID=UPI00197DE0BF|nr:GNAT family protein [Paroceanicella profunda]